HPLRRSRGARSRCDFRLGIGCELAALVAAHAMQARGARRLVAKQNDGLHGCAVGIGRDDGGVAVVGDADLPAVVVIPAEPLHPRTGERPTYVSQAIAARAMLSR